jgi:hypothetical protein
LFHPDTHREDGDPDPAAMAGEKPRRRRHRQSTSARSGPAPPTCSAGRCDRDKPPGTRARHHSSIAVRSRPGPVGGTGTSTL